MTTITTPRDPRLVACEKVRDWYEFARDRYPTQLEGMDESLRIMRNLDRDFAHDSEGYMAEPWSDLQMDHCFNAIEDRANTIKELLPGLY